MGFSQAIIIADEQDWVWNFARQTLRHAGVNSMRLSSRVPVRDSKARFAGGMPVILNWDCKLRQAGALVEDLALLAGDAGVGDRVIVLASSPTREDAIYFGELGIDRVITLRNRDVDLARSTRVFLAHWRDAVAGLAVKPQGSDPARKSSADKQWRALLRHVDQAMEHFWNCHEAEVIKSEDGLDFAVASGGMLQKQGTISSGAYGALMEKAGEFLRREPVSNGQLSAKTMELEACLCLLLGKFDDAISRWSLACETNPNYHRAHMNLSRCLRKLGRQDEALRIIQHRHEHNRLSIQLMVELGDIHLEGEDLLKAEHYYQQALDRDGNSAMALAGLAQVMFARGEMEACRDLLARSGMPSHAAARLNAAGIALVRSGRFEDALELYKKAQFVLPQQEKGPMLFYNMGLCYLRWGRDEIARDFIKLALIKDPDYEKAKSLLKKLETQRLPSSQL
ncbi:MAG: hypothetical protein RIQ81_1270 [Pseudomonadota bacterium]|jgi:tetratricopeptide (TPR) repeat protein